MDDFYKYVKANSCLSAVAEAAMEQLKWAVNMGMWHNVDAKLIKTLATMIAKMQEGDYDMVQLICDVEAKR